MVYGFCRQVEGVPGAKDGKLKSMFACCRISCKLSFLFASPMLWSLSQVDAEVEALSDAASTDTFIKVPLIHPVGRVSAMDHGLNGVENSVITGMTLPVNVAAQCLSWMNHIRQVEWMLSYNKYSQSVAAWEAASGDPRPSMPKFLDAPNTTISELEYVMLMCRAAKFSLRFVYVQFARRASYAGASQTLMRIIVALQRCSPCERLPKSFHQDIPDGFPMSVVTKIRKELIDLVLCTEGLSGMSELKEKESCWIEFLANIEFNIQTGVLVKDSAYGACTSTSYSSSDSFQVHEAEVRLSKVDLSKKGTRPKCFAIFCKLYVADITACHRYGKRI